MRGVMRDWLCGAMLYGDPSPLADLTGVEYCYRVVDGRDAIQRENEADMKRRGLASPGIFANLEPPDVADMRVENQEPQLFQDRR
jgi:hypothetical protein